VPVAEGPRAPTSNHPRGQRRVSAVLRASLALLSYVLCTGNPASAEEDAGALASRALFDDARQLMQDGQFKEACPKLEESQRLRSGIGTQFNLAECYEKVGRHASAWSLYLRVAADTKALGQPDREQVARARAAALEPRIARLSLQVSAPVPGLELTLDGSALGSATWGVATPIDPGEHAVVAQAPGHDPWRGVAQIPDRAAQISLAVPELVRSAPPAAPALVPGHAANDEDPSTSARTLPYVIGGVGIGAVALSGLFGLSVLNKNGEAKKICVDNPNTCPEGEIQRHEELLESARAARNAGLFTFGLGLVGIGVSAVWLLQSDAATDSDASAGFSVDARLGNSDAVLSCSGRF